MVLAFAVWFRTFTYTLLFSLAIGTHSSLARPWAIYVAPYEEILIDVDLPDGKTIHLLARLIEINQEHLTHRGLSGRAQANIRQAVQTARSLDRFLLEYYLSIGRIPPEARERFHEYFNGIGSALHGNSSIVVVSAAAEPDKPLGVLRVAKPVRADSSLPLEERLRPSGLRISRPKIQYSPGGRVPIWSLEEEEPFSFVMERNTVFEGDVIEAKNFVTVSERELGLPDHFFAGLLFSLAERNGMLSVSRAPSNPGADGLWGRHPLVLPSKIAAETNSPRFADYLADRGFVPFATVPDPMLPGQETIVLVADRIMFGDSFYHWYKAASPSTSISSATYRRQWVAKGGPTDTCRVALNP